MKGFIQPYKSSLSECGIFESSTVETIWDFYVSKSIASSSGQKRTATDYGLREIFYEGLMSIAEIPSNRNEMIMADSINAVLKEYDFVVERKGKQDAGEPERVSLEIEIDELRALSMQPYSISDRNKPVGKISKSECLLAHIRNSFAHANTYWLDNGNVLLEDKAGGSSGKTTAMILINSQTLVRWIKAIDIEGRFYFQGEPRDEFLPFVKRQNDNG